MSILRALQDYLAGYSGMKPMRILTDQVEESEIEPFDRQFPAREKHSGTPSQLRFLELAAQVVPAE